MISYIWPLALIIVSNTFYHICAKSSPDNVHPMAVLTVTYVVGAAVSAIMYFVLNRGGNLMKEYTNLNWAPFVLGVVIVGLEVGNIYAYRAGWQISTEAIVQSSFLSIVLLFVGYFFFREHITWNKIAGMVICLAGLYLLNR